MTSPTNERKQGHQQDNESTDTRNQDEQEEAEKISSRQFLGTTITHVIVISSRNLEEGKMKHGFNFKETQYMEWDCRLHLFIQSSSIPEGFYNEHLKAGNEVSHKITLINELYTGRTNHRQVHLKSTWKIRLRVYFSAKEFYTQFHSLHFHELFEEPSWWMLYTKVNLIPFTRIFWSTLYFNHFSSVYEHLMLFHLDFLKYICQLLLFQG